MHASARVRVRGPWEVVGVALGALTVLTGVGIAMRLLPESDRAAWVAFAATIDLAVVLPALYVVLLVKRRGWPALSVVPVFVACLFVASRLVPDEHHGLLTVLEYATIPLELGLVAYVAWKAATTVREMRRRREGGDADFHDVARSTLAEHLPPRIADIAASEVSTLYYALAAWKQRAPDGEAHFTCHRTIGYVAIGIALIVIVTVELVAGHFIVGLFSPTAAWILSALTLYGVVWLIGDLQALRVRSTVVEDGRLTLRVGTRWSGTVDCADVVAIEQTQGHAPEKSPHYLAAVPIGAPSVVLSFARPVTLTGIYGLRRTVRRVGLTIDDPDRFERRIREQQTSAQPPPTYSATSTR